MDIPAHATIIRFSCFAGVLLGMALWEALAPRRRLTVGRPLRWASNLGLVALDALATRLDAVLRWALVTPEMHRVHHSTEPRETNSNFGFNLPWWDYLFGTYRAQPARGHEDMVIGLRQFRDERVADRLHWMLVLPF